MPKPTLPPLAHNLPCPSHNTLDPSAHCHIYDTKLRISFSNPELNAGAFPQSWEAEHFRSGQYDWTTFIPAIIPLDYAMKTSSIYAPAAGSGPGTRKNKENRTSPTEIARDGGIRI